MSNVKSGKESSEYGVVKWILIICGILGAAMTTLVGSLIASGAIEQNSHRSLHYECRDRGARCRRWWRRHELHQGPLHRKSRRTGNQGPSTGLTLPGLARALDDGFATAGRHSPGSGHLRLGLGADTVGAFGELTYSHRVLADLSAFATATGGYLWSPDVRGNHAFGSVVTGVEWNW